MGEMNALRLTLSRCTAALVLAIGLAVVALVNGVPSIGYLLVGGALAFLAVNATGFGRRFGAYSDTDDGESGT